MYQFALTRCIGGRISMNSPSSCATLPLQPSRMWRFSESALYCVRMYTRRRSELMQFDRVMSMMRYVPAKGTAGLARSRVRGKRRSPAPPARRTPSVSFIVMVFADLPESGRHSVRVGHRLAQRLMFGILIGAAAQASLQGSEDKRTVQTSTARAFR